MFEIFTKEGILSFLYFLPALLLSISIHEFGHAYVAYKLGDSSQKAQGRLTLSPFAHIDIVGFICIALFKIGWGKPVLVDDTCFKKRTRDNMLVALAGPLFNLLLALLVTIILKVLIILGATNYLEASEIGKIILTIIITTIQFNVMLAIFNLIPIPPFDGSKILYYFLPYKAKDFMVTLEKYSVYILLLLYITDAYNYIIAPAYSFISWLLNLILIL